MGRDPNRLRVSKDSYMKIIRLLHDRGLDGRPSLSKTRIDIWRSTLFLGTFAWIANLGWRLTIAAPPIRTHQDLDLALDHIVENRTAIEAANAAWDKFSADRSEPNWQAYLGVLAAHDMRHFRA